MTLDFNKGLFPRDNEYEEDGRLQTSAGTAAHEFAKKTIGSPAASAGILSNMWDWLDSSAFSCKGPVNGAGSPSMLFDLERLFTIKSIFAYITIQSGGTVNWTYRLKYSRDNTNWTNIREEASKTGNASYTDSDGAFKARYIKLEMINNSGTNSGSGTFNGLNMFEVNIYV